MKTLFRAAAAGVLALAAVAATITPTTTTLFLRQEGCGEDAQAGRLSVVSGVDDSDGCGPIGGLPFNNVEFPALIANSEPEPFTTVDGVPAILDASRDVELTIRAESWFGGGIPGAGESAVDVKLTARIDGVTVTIGEATSTITNQGDDAVTHEITLDVADELDGLTATSLTLSVFVRGNNLNTNNLGLSGDSFVRLPTLEITEDEEA